MQFILIHLLCIRLIDATVQLSSSEFNNQDWAALKDCLRSMINNYDVIVEDGWINVGPVAHAILTSTESMVHCKRALSTSAADF